MIYINDILYYINKLLILCLLYERHYYHIFLFMLFNISISKQAHKNNNFILTFIVVITTYSMIEHNINHEIYKYIITTCNMYQLLMYLYDIHSTYYLLLLSSIQLFLIINMTNKQQLTLFIAQNSVFL